MNMVQGSGRRERKRIERHQAFLVAAKRIVFSEGIAALTMQRLAKELDCAVGTAYSYYPSKSALVAELQREAIEVIDASCDRFERRARRHLAEHVKEERVRALALIQGYLVFWAETFDVFPEEARLLQMLMSETSRPVDDRDVSRVVPVALRLLDRLRQAIDEATDRGALAPASADQSGRTLDNALERAVLLAAALNGVLLVEHVARVDPTLFDSRRLGNVLVDDLLAGWGADRDTLADAQRALKAMADRGPLATRRTEGSASSGRDVARGGSETTASSQDTEEDPS